MAYKRTRTGTIITKNGVRITERKRKELRYLVNRANLKRKEVLSQYSQRRKNEATMLKNGNRNGDFITAPKSQKLSRFENQQQFNQYMAKLRKISSGEYQNKMYRQYRKNLMASLRHKFGSEGDVLARKIGQLTDVEIRNITLGDKLHDIGWVYNEPVKDDKKFNIISQQIDDIVSKRGA